MEGKMWKSKIVAVVDDRIKKIIEDIKMKDSTFICNFDEEGIVIFDNDKNRLHKRSMWLIHKAKIGTGYNISWEK
jgi:hypothetical protein